MQTYQRYHGGAVEPGALIIKFYHSGGQIRGYIRKVTGSDDDTVFPGEEMEPADAFRMAENKNRGPDKSPILIELTEGVEWDPGWGKLL